MSRIRTAVIYCWCAAVLAACSDGVPSSPARVDPARPLATLGRLSRIRSIADEYRDLGRQLPGFTGVRFDSSGNGDLIVAVARDGFRPEQAREVASWVERYTGSRTGASAVRLKRVQYSYLELDSVLEHVLLPAIGRLDFLTSTAIDENEGQIRLTVAEGSYRGAIHAVANRLGVPQSMLRVYRQPRASAPEAGQQCWEDCGGSGGGGGGGGGGLTLQDYVRPMYGGMQIKRAGSGACTIGFTGYAVDTTTGYPDPNLGVYAMTASHCAVNRGVLAGTTYGQPVADSTFGYEVWTAPLYTQGCSYTSCQDVDVMVLRYYDPDASGYGLVTKTNLNSLTITGTETPVGNIYGVLVGSWVRKVGRTTGTTYGEVTATCASMPTSTRGHNYGDVS